MALINFNEIFDCKHIEKFTNSIVRHLDYGGASDSLFYLCEHNSIRFLTKVTFYQKTTRELYKVPCDGLPRGLMEINALQILDKKLTSPGLVSGIIQILHAKTCDHAFAQMKGLSSSKPSLSSSTLYSSDINYNFASYKELVKNGLAHDKISFIVLEHCNDDFAELIHKLPPIDISLVLIESLVFQIAHTLAQIEKVLPGTKHNDLHMGNVLSLYDKSHHYDVSRPKWLKYYYGADVYYIPYFGIMMKIIDWEWSSIPSEGLSSEVIGNPRIAYSRPQDVSDLIIFMSFMWGTVKHMPYFRAFVKRLFDKIDLSGRYKSIKSDIKTSNIDALFTRGFEHFKASTFEPSADDIIDVYGKE